MHKTIISDCSCFFVLSNIDELELLHKIYGIVITTHEILQEFGQPLPEWILIQSPADKLFQQELEIQLDKGEASAIALAIEISECIIILDDIKARKIAENLGLEITGTIGVLIKAKQNKIISAVKPYLEKLKLSGFRISKELENRALAEAEEI